MAFPSFKNILLGNKYCSIEVFSLASEEGVALIFVEKKNNEIEIINKEKRSTPEQLVNKPDNSQPVILIINNNFIIQKEVEITDLNENKIINKAFPNLNIDDFYYQISNIESKKIIAICRKNYVAELLEKYNSLGFAFSHISLGLCSISNIEKYIESDIIKTNHQLVSFANGEPLFHNFENKKVEIYELNGLKIPNTYLVAFSGIINILSPSNKYIGSVSDVNDTLTDKFYQRRFFDFGLKTGISFLLILLFINFIIFNYYLKKTNELSANMTISKNITEKVDAAKKRLIVKEEKIKSTYNKFNSKSSLIINEVVKNLPNSILLNELTYHPLEKKIKIDEEIIVQNDILLITGLVYNSNDFTSWVQNLENSKWIKSITITQYGKNENKQTFFNVKINITNEAK